MEEVVGSVCVWVGGTMIRNDENQINSGSPILLRAQHFER